jgi:hypothetical protein
MNEEIKFKKFPLLNSKSEPLANITLEHLWADVFALKMKVLKIEGVPRLGEVIQEALKEANGLKARMVMFRLIKGETASQEISDLLPKLGFKKKSERIEFKKSVDELPSDDGSPIKWKNAEELGWGPQEIAKTFKKVAEGDPDTDPNEDPLLFIHDFLSDSVLTSGLQCIHLGFVDGEIAAFTVVQVNPKTGWSRISYMGLMPQFRKQSLGRWVHSYSFKIMKSEGGKVYHGGTTSTNARMIRLFENSGCDKFCEMEEWNYTLGKGNRID